jgi:hypothetical protein
LTYGDDYVAGIELFILHVSLCPSHTRFCCITLSLNIHIPYLSWCAHSRYTLLQLLPHATRYYPMLHVTAVTIPYYTLLQLLPHSTRYYSYYPCYTLLQLLPHATRYYSYYPMLHVTTVTTPCYTLLQLLPHATRYYSYYPMLHVTTVTTPLQYFFMSSNLCSVSVASSRNCGLVALFFYLHLILSRYCLILLIYVTCVQFNSVL